MKKAIILGIILITVVIVSVFLIYENGFGSPSSTDPNIPCQDNQDYFVVSRYKTNSVGSDTLIKYKTTDDQKIRCKYVVEEGDFEIKNEWAEYFYTIIDHYIVLDSGTGPDIRGLVIYDANTRTKVYEGNYTNSGGFIEKNGNTLTYWEVLQDEKVTYKNCPQMDEYGKEGWGAAIERRVTLTFDDESIKKETGEKKCGRRQ